MRRPLPHNRHKRDELVDILNDGIKIAVDLATYLTLVGVAVVACIVLS